jgi:hypothetical protein
VLDVLTFSSDDDVTRKEALVDLTIFLAKMHVDLTGFYRPYRFGVEALTPCASCDPTDMIKATINFSH